MSDEVDVIPLSAKPVSWGEVKQSLSASVFDADLRSYFGANRLSLFEARTKRLLEDGDALPCPGYYSFSIEGKNCTLSMAIEPSADCVENADYLGDFARNLSDESKETLQQQWEQAGYLITVESYGGRPRHEIRAMMLVAICLARVTEGVVLVTDSIVGLMVGVYSPEEIDVASINEMEERSG